MYGWHVHQQAHTKIEMNNIERIEYVHGRDEDMAGLCFSFIRMAWFPCAFKIKYYIKTDCLLYTGYVAIYRMSCLFMYSRRSISFRWSLIVAIHTINILCFFFYFFFFIFHISNEKRKRQIKQHSNHLCVQICCMYGRDIKGCQATKIIEQSESKCWME